MRQVILLTENGTGLITSLAKMKKAELLEVVEGYDITVGILQESLAELNLAMEDVGWRRLGADVDRDLFSPQGLIDTIKLARASYLSNPLINHAVNVQADYVFAQGVSVRAKPDGPVNDAVQNFWDNPQNRRTFTTQQQLWMKETRLRTEANIFIVLFTNIFNGDTVVRTVPPEQIITGGIITNPDDDEEVWFYRRVWQQMQFNPATGIMSSKMINREEYYPDWQYNPRIRVPSINGKPVNWESPIYHLKVGHIDGSKFGVPEIYSALPWARAVRLDLEDYATVRRALARFAWNLKVKGGKNAVAQAKSKLHTAINSENALDTNPPPIAGSAFIANDDRDLAPIKVAGATQNPEEGRRLWLMVSAGTGIPETILAGNADVGNLATARTLDRPTELQMRNRQTLWEGVIEDIGRYVLGSMALSGGSPVTGILTNGVLSVRPPREPGRRGRPAATLQPVEVVVNFPSILEPNRTERVTAVVDAATLKGRSTTGMFPNNDLLRRLLEALGEADIDGAMAMIAQTLETPEEEPAVPTPEVPPAVPETA